MRIFPSFNVGLNGEYAYIDRLDYPYPAIRWAEPDSKTDSLREKEKGDWKNLSIEDKKNLYRLVFHSLDKRCTL